MEPAGEEELEPLLIYGGEQLGPGECVQMERSLLFTRRAGACNAGYGIGPRLKSIGLPRTTRLQEEVVDDWRCLGRSGSAGRMTVTCICGSFSWNDVGTNEGSLHGW